MPWRNTGFFRAASVIKCFSLALVLYLALYTGDINIKVTLTGRALLWRLAIPHNTQGMATPDQGSLSKKGSLGKKVGEGKQT